MDCYWSDIWICLSFFGGYTTNKKIATKQAKLEALLKEAEERRRAYKVMDTVRNMSADDVRRRLQNLTDK